MAQEWWLVRPVTPVLRGLAGSVARGRSHTGSAPRRAPDVGEVSALRPAARTGEEGAASGEPAGGPRAPYFRSGDRFQPVWGISCPGSGPDRETRCCGPLRASNGRAMAVAGPFRGPLGACPGSPVRVPGAGGGVPPQAAARGSRECAHLPAGAGRSGESACWPGPCPAARPSVPVGLAAHHRSGKALQW